MRSLVSTWEQSIVRRTLVIEKVNTQAWLQLLSAESWKRRNQQAGLQPHFAFEMWAGAAHEPVAGTTPFRNLPARSGGS